MSEKRTKAEIEAENEMLKQMLAMFGMNSKKDNTPEEMRRKDVTITNLSEGQLILKQGDGRTLILDKQFESRKITREQCRSIVSNMPNTYLDGYFLLCKNGQEEIADLFTESEIAHLKTDVLSVEQIQNVYSFDLDMIEGIYNRIKPAHKEMMRNKLRNMIERGMKVDIRLKELMSNLTGIDYINMAALEDEDIELIRSHGGTI